ncbi:DUF1799 domain-containing protein [Variovorax ginsengisoli]|uniref:DUF1799 domain-containing protein n=1 Tax=Variovorax ginsengisoli TaxID=363844 RepID=A0ABT8RZ70_9BURK|nr:DUF1799 domain-containing protein [Variovorax ginsengisoli]MDN8612800.1 DUF1799 domain-containing protein [Variovorax ginsengisoli]MDO1531970.1 DUF1799 domain-containing protein [Variovorax ginsengisoli]
MFDPPDWAARAAWDLTPEDFPDEELGIWPENWMTVSVFCAMRTQWRAGMNGAYGLDLGVLPEIWRRLKVPSNERDEIFEHLLLMEGMALQQMQAQKNKASQ